jgi:hypothetical protein
MLQNQEARLMATSKWKVFLAPSRKHDYVKAAGK